MHGPGISPINEYKRNSARVTSVTEHINQPHVVTDVAGTPDGWSFNLDEGDGERAREPHHVSRGFVYQRVYSWIGAREIIQP